MNLHQLLADSSLPLSTICTRIFARTLPPPIYSLREMSPTLGSHQGKETPRIRWQPDLATLCGTQCRIAAHHITTAPVCEAPLPKTRNSPSSQHAVGSHDAPHSFSNMQTHVTTGQHTEVALLLPVYLVG